MAIKNALLKTSILAIAVLFLATAYSVADYSAADDNATEYIEIDSTGTVVKMPEVVTWEKVTDGYKLTIPENCPDLCRIKLDNLSGLSGIESVTVEVKGTLNINCEDGIAVHVGANNYDVIFTGGGTMNISQKAFFTGILAGDNKLSNDEKYVLRFDGINVNVSFDGQFPEEPLFISGGIGTNYMGVEFVNSNIIIKNFLSGVVAAGGKLTVDKTAYFEYVFSSEKLVSASKSIIMAQYGIYSDNPPMASSPVTFMDKDIEPVEEWESGTVAFISSTGNAEIEFHFGQPHSGAPVDNTLFATILAIILIILIVAGCYYVFFTGKK